MRLLRLIGRGIRSLWNRFIHRPRYNTARPKMKLKPGDWKKMMLRKGMTIANIDKLEKSLFKAKDTV